MIPAEIMGPMLKSNVRNFKVQILDILAYMLSFFFIYFKNQQFITWGARADHGSYFITMYRQTESTLK